MLVTTSTNLRIRRLRRFTHPFPAKEFVLRRFRFFHKTYCAGSDFFLKLSRKTGPDLAVMVDRALKTITCLSCLEMTFSGPETFIRRRLFCNRKPQFKRDVGRHEIIQCQALFMGCQNDVLTGWERVNVTENSRHLFLLSQCPASTW